MKQVFVGVVQLGHEQIDVYLREGTGGEFYTIPEKGSLPRIKVGADQCWKDVVSCLSHEATEFCTMRMECRFAPSSDYARDHSGYVFVMTHPQFSEITARVAWFLADTLPLAATLYRKWKKKK